MECTRELNLDTESGPRQSLRLVLRADGRLDPRLTLHVVQRGLQLTYDWGCWGCDLARFVDELERLHATLEGEALFYDLDQVVEITIRVIERGRGRLSTEVRIDQRLEGIENSITLRGFEIEQSYLPGMVRDIRQFISESGVSVRPPG